MRTRWPEAYNAPEDVRAIEVIPLADWRVPATTYELLQRAASTWPDRTATSTLPDAERWRLHSDLTFSELRDRVHQVANVLHDLGVRRGHGVGLLAPNCEELVVAMLGAQLAGFAAPLNPGLNASHLRALLERTGTRVLVAAGPELNSDIWESALALKREGAVDVVLALRPTRADAPAPALSRGDDADVGYLFDHAMEQHPCRFIGTPPDSSDIAAVFHTGGTTGLPKLAAHTHANEVADAWMIAANTALDERSVIFAALPLFHVNALVVTLLAPLMRGQQVVWAGPAGYRDLSLYTELWKVVEHFGISTMSAVPTVYQALAQAPVDADISSMRTAIVGASPLPQAVRESFEGATGIPLLEGYGLTEATCASVRGFVDFRKPGSVGQRMPYQQIKVINVKADGTWTDAPVGTVGVLAISGPTVFAGYVTGRDENGLTLDGLGKISGGWLDTGDLARVDEEGFVFLTGRAKDLIIRGGHNIDPASIEDVLLAHPSVAATAAVGRPDPHSGEVPVAYVALHPGETAGEAELVAWAADRVAEAAAAPKSVTILDSIPVTDVGKPYKLALRADAAASAVSQLLRDASVEGSVTTVIEDGSVSVIIDAKNTVGVAEIEAVLAPVAVFWRLLDESGSN